MCGEKNSEKNTEFYMGIGLMTFQTLVGCLLSEPLTELLRTLVI